MLTTDYVESFLSAATSEFRDHKITITVRNGQQVVDVEGHVELNIHKVKDKIPFKFGKVSGCFRCDSCNLTTLENCPDYVGGKFNCSNNKLYSLEHAPKYIGGDAHIYFSNHHSLTPFTPDYLKKFSDVKGIIYYADKDGNTIAAKMDN